MSDQSREMLLGELESIIARFDTYCDETPQTKSIETSPVLNKGEVMGLFPSTPSLGVYEELRRHCIDAAVANGPRHRA